MIFITSVSIIELHKAVKCNIVQCEHLLHTSVLLISTYSSVNHPVIYQKMLSAEQKNKISLVFYNVGQLFQEIFYIIIDDKLSFLPLDLVKRSFFFKNGRRKKNNKMSKDTEKIKKITDCTLVLVKLPK